MNVDAQPRSAKNSSERLLADAFEGYQRDGGKSADRVLAALYQDTRVKRIIEHNVRKSKVIDHKDEVFQRLALIFWDKLLPLMLQEPNEPDNVYKVIYAGANRVSLSLRKESARDAVRTVSTDEPDEDMISVVDEHVQSEDFTIGVDRRIDQEHAGIELQRRLAMTKSLHPLVKIGEAPPPLVPRKRSKPSTPDVDAAAELKAIREKLSITNPEFANRLGVGLPALSSYLYGRVQNVPQAVMDAARALVNDGPTDHDAAVAFFSKMTLPDVISRWEKKLKIEGNDLADRIIATVLEVNQITVWRWRNGKSKLTVSEIAAHDRTINTFANKPAGKK